MKKCFILVCSMFLVSIGAYTQCAECRDEDDWKFAAGVTLFNNSKNGYVSKTDFLERRPLEFDFRYRINNHHTLRMGIPFAWKVNGTGGNVFPPLSIDETMDNKAAAYIDAMREEPFLNYCEIKQLYNRLIGVALGYDYDFPLSSNLSFFAGVDLAYNYLYFYSEYYIVTYDKLDGNNISNLLEVSYVKSNTANYNAYSVRPLAGGRVNFRNLMFECSLGYSFSKVNFNGKFVSQSADFPNFGTNHLRYPINFTRFLYQISLFYYF